MTTGAIVLAAVAAVVMALIARARAEQHVYHKDWSQITSKDNLLPVEQNNIGIGLVLYKLDEFINNHTSGLAGCNDGMLNTEAYSRNNAEKSCCKATGNSIAELTDTIKETQAHTQLQMEVLLLAVSTTMESVRTLTQLVRDHLIKGKSRHGRDGRKRTHRNEVVGKPYYSSKRKNRNKGNEVDKASENEKTKGKVPGKDSYPPKKVEPSTTDKKKETPPKPKDKVQNKEKENTDTIKEDNEESKNEKYRLLTETHTALLPPKDDCNISKTGISEEEKIEILKLHNDLRSQIALGQEQRGAPGPQPEGANIRELVWNDELADIGQAWASQCPSDHDCKLCRKMITRDYNVGQNIFEQWTNSFKPPQVWASAVNGWYNEVKDLPNDYVKAFQPVPPSGAKIGHYTQVAWAETNEVGCGAIIFHTVKQGRQAPASKKYVCNYGPAGNYLDTEMYIIGPAASQCPNGISDNYPALCK